jgi:anaerobic magnesium-protoporphyrin IX monomethyl ester cyclase
MKNILLVEPGSADVNIFSLFKIPRMGLAILGTIARNAGYSVRIIYEETTPLSFRHIEWADLVGISLTTSTAGGGYRLARLVRVVDKQCGRVTPIVFGGVHATFEPDEALSNGDFVLRGEAEETFVPFLNALFGARDFEAVPALSYGTENGNIHNPLPRTRVCMDSVPTPDWNLFWGYKPKIGIAMTSRGCPYDCSFCSVTAMLGRAYRMRSADLVIADLAASVSKHVFFYDDNFAANGKRTKMLLRRIIAGKNKTHFVQTFAAQVRSDIAKDPELLDLMKEAGFNQFYIGFESVNPATLEIYNKKQSVSDIEFSIEEIHRRGICVHGMFVFGSDADEKETFDETIRFARKNRIDTVQFLILTPLPGTNHFKTLEEEGRIICYEWSRFDAFNAVFLPKKMSPYNLQVLTLRAMKRFYSISRSVKFVLTGRLYLAALNAYGRLTLFLWRRHNRKWLDTIKKDSVQVFVPELMRASCPAPGVRG